MSPTELYYSMARYTVKEEQFEKREILGELY